MLAHDTPVGMLQDLTAIGACACHPLGRQLQFLLMSTGALEIFLHGPADGIGAGENDASILPGGRGTANAP